MCYSKYLESKKDRSKTFPVSLTSRSSLPEKFYLITGAEGKWNLRMSTLLLEKITNMVVMKE